MTEQERDRRISEINADKTIRSAAKKRRIESVLLAFRSSTIVDNGKGQTIARSVWDDMSHAQRQAFIAGELATLPN